MIPILCKMQTWVPQFQQKGHWICQSCVCVASKENLKKNHKNTGLVLWRCFLVNPCVLFLFVWLHYLYNFIDRRSRIFIMLSGYTVCFFFAVFGDNTVKTMLGPPPPPEKYLLFLVFIFEEISRLSFSLPSQNYSDLVNYNSFIFLPLPIICQIAHLCKKKKILSLDRREKKKQSYPAEFFAWIFLAIKIATYWLKKRTKTKKRFASPKY